MPDQQPGADLPGRLGQSDLVLRRLLVDEDLMRPEHGVYWRTGGTVDVEGARGGPDEAGPA